MEICDICEKPPKIHKKPKAGKNSIKSPIALVILDGPDPTFIHKLYRDHDHVLKLARGRLCNRCNSIVGMLETNRNLVDKAEEYIKEWKERHAFSV